MIRSFFRITRLSRLWRMIPHGYRSWSLNLFIFALLVLLFQWSIQPGKSDSIIHRMNGMLYDVRLSTMMDDSMEAGTTAIVVVDIDEKSLQQYGRWPWSRETIVSLLQHIKAQGALITAFDIVFSEPERNLIERIRERPESAPIQDFLQTLEADYDFDGKLAQQFTEQDVILGYLFLNAEADRTGYLPASPFAASSLYQAMPVQSFAGYAAPLEMFVESALGSGYVTIQPDVDGIIRRAPLILKHDDVLYPSLALETARQFLLAEHMNIKSANVNGVESIVNISLDNVVIPTNEFGEAAVPYRGGAKSFPYISAADILNGEEIPELADSIVLVGTSAVGLADLRSTPLQPFYPGVEIHANIIDAIVNERPFPYQPDWFSGASVLVMLLSTLILTYALPRLGALMMPLVSFTLLGALIGFNFYSWKYWSLDLPLFIPALLVVVISLKEIAGGFLGEQSQRKMIKGHFDKYVPPAHIERMMSNPDGVNLDGEKKEMSVLFSDIRSFTTISEKLSTQELKLLLNLYFTPITGIIFDNQGTVDKFVGDMVMAFWNAPLDVEDHAHYAIKAAMEMLKKTEDLRADFAQRGLPPVFIGVGVNTGEMNVGDMGSDTRRNYTVLGDAVNLGARLEGLTKFYGADLLVGESTRAVAPKWLYRHMDRVAVKGKEKPVDIYEPQIELALAPAELIAKCERHEEAMEYYISGDFAQSLAIFTELGQQYPSDKIYPLFLERITVLMESDLPDDWHGVYIHTSK
ncbi:CHASE2 domain-containing protein [Thalassolituus oleivorans]|uniref:CHASE2 domain-containing protein n=1 Tax=Thalassolituus oleivorans TaxID=187493 RepID=UPI00240A04C1|nr:adenylate/guanylate cyclase domain-containing protein [Thalassolituus oleivorans]MDF1640936.1 adenylate/guanylate cyclase domain-containing protein [Thalassolituus oleivorans]